MNKHTTVKADTMTASQGEQNKEPWELAMIEKLNKLYGTAKK